MAGMTQELEGVSALAVLARINGRNGAPAANPATRLERFEQALAIPPRRCPRSYRVLTRILDVAVALAVLTFLAPLMAWLSIAIRRDSPGPALFRQVRFGLNGRQFTLWKLRTMFVDARDRFPDLFDYRCTYEQGRHIRFHRKNDPRVTRVGRFLRRTSLDELPNFYSVLKGEMSLVGPRPQLPELIPYYGPLLNTVLSVKPGVFSLPKVWFRDELELGDTILLDAWYAHHQSLRLDYSIMVRGIWVTLTRRYVY
jgi:lipopolysaccharide/colanic/teichoic acid biosynthesis glycosyltransferase